MKDGPSSSASMLATGASAAGGRDNSVIRNTSSGEALRFGAHFMDGEDDEDELDEDRELEEGEVEVVGKRRFGSARRIDFGHEPISNAEQGLNFVVDSEEEEDIVVT